MKHPEKSALDDDDLAWAKPYVDEALASLARGEGMTLEEHRKRVAARLAALKKQER
jgi:antitoxin ParD1/3/4